MKQIYNFDKVSPPDLNEHLIREQIKLRKVNRDAFCVAFGGLVLMICLALAAILVSDTLPLISTICLVYVCIAVTGGSVIALIYKKKKEEISKWSEVQL